MILARYLSNSQKETFEAQIIIFIGTTRAGKQLLQLLCSEESEERTADVPGGRKCFHASQSFKLITAVQFLKIM